MLRNAKNQIKEPFSFKALKELLGVYLAFFFLLFPLYYERNYYRIGAAKWKLFKGITFYFRRFFITIPTAIPFMILLFFLHQRYLTKEGTRDEFWKNISKTDICVFVYAIVCVLSCLFTSFRENVVWGVDGWYCGLVFQIAIVLLYFFMSRYWRWDDIMFMAYLGASAVVFLLAVFHRFSIDPFHFYDGLRFDEKTKFLSTLGQNTWFSSYMVLLFPMGLFAFWYVEKKAYRISTLLYLILGSMTLVTQDSDSAYFALFAIFGVLFAASFRSNHYMIRFFESIVVMLTTWRITGLLQMIFSDKVLTIGRMMLFLSQSPLMWFPWIVSVAIYVLLRKADKKGNLDITKFKWTFKALMGLVAAGLILIVIYIILNTNGILPESMRSSNNYLLFNDEWGNHRGINWKIAVQTFALNAKRNPVMAIVGSGPDSYMQANMAYFSDAIIAYFKPLGGGALQSAHNEMLTMLIWGGIIGTAAYSGIFFTAAVRYYKASIKNPELLAVVMAVAAYMAHNFFCYQQVLCTPTIFIIMGAGECIMRLGELRLISDGG